MALTKVIGAGLGTVTEDQVFGGATPTVTIGDAGAEDAKIVFDGNAQDYHIGLDDSADTLVIGKGSALGTTTAITIDSDENVAIGVTSKNSSNNGSLTIGHTGMTKVTASANGNADELVLIGANASANVGMSIIGNNANQNIIYFGDEDDADIGGIIYDHNGDYMAFQTNTAEAMRIDSIGAVTKPLQPAFLVQPTSAQNNISHGSNVTVVFNNERFDQNADFNSSNYTFTAPVTGKYFFSYSLWVANIDNQPSYWETYIITSNRNYLYTIDPRAFDQDAGSFTFNNSLVADMDSGDTAKIQVLQQNSGTEQADIQNYSFFSGALIC